MSYDIVIKTKTGETLQFPTTHGLLAELAILYFPKEELKWDGD